MTLPSSLNRWCNCKKSWSPERPKWKEWEFGSTMAQPRSWYLSRGDVLHNFGKEPCGMCLKCTNAVFCGGCPSCLHKKSSGISGPLKPYSSFRYKRRTGQARSKDSRIMTWVTVSGEKLGVVPSIWGNLGTLGTAYSQMAVVNSLLSQNTVSHGAHSTSSCPSSPTACSPSPPEKEFTISVSGVSCFMQAKHGPQTSRTCSACNAMTEQWFAGCTVSQPMTNSARRICWWRCSLMIWQRYSVLADSDGMPCWT